MQLYETNMAYVPYWDVTRIKNIKSKHQIAAEFEKMLIGIFVKEAGKPIFSRNRSFQSKMYMDLYYMHIIDSVAGNTEIYRFFNANLKTGNE